MRIARHLSHSLPRQASIALLAAAIGIPVWAQQATTQAPPASRSDFGFAGQPAE